MDFKYSLTASGNTKGKINLSSKMEMAGATVEAHIVADNLQSAAEQIVKYIESVVDKLG